MKNLFQQTLKVGKSGEEAVKQYYLNKGVEVIDVSNNKVYQEKDIDVILNGQTVEIKTGTQIPYYQELCVEIVSNATESRYKPGWLYTTEAQILIYYSPIDNRMYQVFTDDLRNYYEEHKETIKTKKIYKTEYNDISKPSIIAFIPIAEIEKNITNYRTITISD